jgi:hypothetical protein
MALRSGLLASSSESLKVFGNFVEGVGDFSDSGQRLYKPAPQLNFEGIEDQGSIDLAAVFSEVRVVIIGQPGAFALRSDGEPRRGHKFLNSNSFERMNDPLKFRGQGTHVVAQLRKQFMLNDIPALHDQVALGGINRQML